MKNLHIGGYGPGILTLDAGLTPAPSPSFLAVHPTLPVLYAVGELGGGLVTAYATDDGLTETARRSSEGDSPCHVAVHPSGELLAVANYGDGTVSLHHLDAEGGFTGDPIVRRHEGTGPRADRQERSHAHQCVFHDDVLHVPDLGTDEIRRYTLTGEPLEFVRLTPGMGPRHLSFARGSAFVAGELDATVREYDESWQQVTEVAASEAEGENFPSHIEADGDHVYVANRGPDTIAVFTKGAKVAEVPSGGAWPRHFAIEGDTLWVANQNSHNVAIFTLVNGIPRPTGENIEVKSPACIVPV